MVQQWVDKTGFKIYSTSTDKPRQGDRWQYTRVTLQALHTTRAEQFYRYLSQLLVSMADDELKQLLQSALDLNKKEKTVLTTFILEQNKHELAVWLSRRTELEKRLANDDEFYAKLFNLLTRTTMSNTERCHEMLLLDDFKGVREKRYAVLQCLALAVNLYIVDIDISRNRIVTTKILGPGPVSTALASSPAIIPDTVQDNSEYPFSTIPELYDNPQINPVIFLTSPLANGFLVSYRKSQKSSRPPVSPLTMADIDKMRQRYQQANKGKQLKHEKSRHFLSVGKRNPHWLEGWLASPGYTIAGSLAIAVIMTLVATMAPYPGNPWLGA